MVTSLMSVHHIVRLWQVAWVTLVLLICAPACASAFPVFTTVRTGGHDGVASAVGVDGAIWILANRPGPESALVRVAGDGRRVGAFPIPNSLSIFSELVAAQDGNLWYPSEREPSRSGAVIVRTTTAGVRTAFPAGFGDTPAISSLAAGPWDQLYFDGDDVRGHHVARISLDGRVNRLVVARRPPGSRLKSAGGTWLSNGYEVTRAGRVRDIPGTPNHGVLDVRGNFWFTDGGSFYRLTPHGTISRFRYVPSRGPSVSDVIWALAPGPDGNIWFVKSIDGGEGFSGDDGVGEIDPSGHITTYPMPGNSVARTLTAAPDGRIWIPVAGGFPHIIRVAPDRPAGGWPRAARPSLTSVHMVTGGVAVSLRCRGTPGLYCGGQITISVTAHSRSTRLTRTAFLGAGSQGLDLVLRPHGLRSFSGRRATVTVRYATKDFLGRREHAFARHRFQIP